MSNLEQFVVVFLSLCLIIVFVFVFIFVLSFVFRLLSFVFCLRLLSSSLTFVGHVQLPYVRMPLKLSYSSTYYELVGLCDALLGSLEANANVNPLRQAR